MKTTSRTTTPDRAVDDRPAGVTAAARTAALAVWLIPLHGLLLLWGAWERQPDPTSRFADWADFVSTDEFLWNHVVVSIAGQTAAVVATAALTLVLLTAGARSGRALTGFTLHAVGSGLLLAGFGIAAFAQPAIGALHDEHPAIAQEMYDAVFTPLTITTLVTGAALYGLSTIWTGLALRSLTEVPTWARWLYVASGPLFAIVGFFIGAVQMLGALAFAVAGVVVARAAVRRARA